MFGSLADALSRHLHVIRWDQRGSGRSEHERERLLITLGRPAAGRALLAPAADTDCFI
jgi:pimeloyl-ACP methyl ester carboxylesterase